VPIVFDVLNFKEGVQHMWRTLGNWTFAFTDYRDMNVTLHLNDGTDNLDVLAAQVDPLVYKENLTMAKLVVDATGDEFFQPQDDAFWWGQLPGESLRMMVDNAEHSMATGALYLLTGAETWLKALLEGSPRPSFTWSLNAEDGSITVQVNGPLQPVLKFAVVKSIIFATFYQQLLIALLVALDAACRVDPLGIHAGCSA
jgi:PhoPQ-activated pathogenicity-related protein